MGHRSKTSADTSAELRTQLKAAMGRPNIIFGYGSYSPRWPNLNKLTGGLQELNLSVIASRPKVGKSMFASDLIPDIAEQAMAAGEVVRVISLEMRRVAYQRRMAAIMAKIADPKRIRQGFLDSDEVRRYNDALDTLEYLPIEYLSNETDLTDAQAMVPGNSTVTIDEVIQFVKAPGRDTTYYWFLDHIGLLADLSQYGDVTTNIFALANKLMLLAHTTASGMVITHLKRGTGRRPTIDSIAASDQVGRNADQIFLLSRPFFEAEELSEADVEATRDGEPSYLEFYSRDEGSGTDVLWWSKQYASFSELDVSGGVVVSVPTGAQRHR